MSKTRGYTKAHGSEYLFVVNLGIDSRVADEVDDPLLAFDLAEP